LEHFSLAGFGPRFVELMLAVARGGTAAPPRGWAAGSHV